MRNERSHSLFGRVASACGILLLTTAACGSAGESSQVDDLATPTSEAPAAQTDGDGAAAAPIPTTLITTSSTISVRGNESSAFGQRVLAPGWYQTSQSDPPIRFEVAPRASDIRWYGRFENEWGIVMIIESPEARAHPSKEPGLVVALSEDGSTVASVTDQLVASQRETRFSVSVHEGQLAGQPASIVTHESLREGTNWSIVQMKTGGSSFFDVIYEEGRVIETYVLAEGDRVVVYSFNSHRDLLDLVRTESLALVDSVEFGG